MIKEDLEIADKYIEHMHKVTGICRKYLMRAFMLGYNLGAKRN